ncbi:hypothetical protein [Bdellovibrio sp. NC01]|uniref:hypothetical protein n=1 Tax=Bdellovibrio sp. NC01 TaxID=2220073 RepID=UPI0011584815|nr:hypothetical protein [Bdellovibrio sp. NC01]QDK38681.1 hypothetical protein DOE51_14350 [Bdellovibrio sp. NC01]
MVEIEPQRRQPQRINKQDMRKPQPREHQEVVEGMTERDHKSEDYKDSPLRIFMGTEIFLLVAGLVIGAVYFFFFRQ